MNDYGLRMPMPTLEQKRRESAALAADVEAFLASGGKIRGKEKVTDNRLLSLWEAASILAIHPSKFQTAVKRGTYKGVAVPAIQKRDGKVFVFMDDVKAFQDRWARLRNGEERAA